MKRLIIGCGYLGLPTAKRWLAAGDEVVALTRQSDRFSTLQALGIKPILGDITQADSLAELSALPPVDTILFAVGMDRSRYDDIRGVYVDGLMNVLAALPAKAGHLIYISSTGVYGNSAGEFVNETTIAEPTRAGGQACLEAEALIRSSQFSAANSNNEANHETGFTILRLAGIYGPNRIPLLSAIESQQWDQLSPNGFLNLIHVADAARIIERVTEQKLFGEMILVSDGNPVPRKTFYETIARLSNQPSIPWEQFADSNAGPKRSGDKRIDNAKLRRLIGDDFWFPDYLAGLRHELLKS